MALKSESKRIGLHDYKVTQVDAIKGRRALARIAKVVAPLIAAAQSGSSDSLAKALENFSETDVDYFCDLFAASTEVSGGEYQSRSPQLSDVFMVHFADRYDEMLKWLAFAMKVNFSSFFRGWASIAREISGKVQESP